MQKEWIKEWWIKGGAFFLPSFWKEKKSCMWDKFGLKKSAEDAKAIILLNSTIIQQEEQRWVLKDKWNKAQMGRVNESRHWWNLEGEKKCRTRRFLHPARNVSASNEKGLI